ncbi:MAG: dTMP kinase [Acidimicrobiia bacterium]|nr:dTMP kinase [Acidimicrobiia bacterium]MBV8985899.1 dTMP kinase [Acidimicrobiia bacterium]
MRSVPRGRLIVFEGGEASGKSTQAARLAAQLGAVLTREPGGTHTGKRIRELVLDPGAPAIAPATEALLMAADRAQHVAEVIEPALAAGTDVVTDRYVPSTLAYQGFGRGMDIDGLRRLSKDFADAVEPDLVVLLDVPASVAAERLRGRDRMEAAGDDFHARVAEGYRALAGAEPHRWVVVDGAGSVDEVAARVRDAVDAWLSSKG